MRSTVAPLRFIALFVSLCLIGPLSKAAAEAPFELVVVCDSLTAGFGLDNPNALAEGLAARLERAGLDHVRIRPAGVSGDTAAGARARFDWSVGDDADGVLIEIGANDMFTGRPPEAIAADIAAMVAKAQSRGLWVGLVGMRAPRNVGRAYRQAFDGLYPALAARTCVALYPFYFEGLIDPDTGAADDTLFLPDGVHPNADGVARVAERMGDWLAEALRRKTQCG